MAFLIAQPPLLLLARFDHVPCTANFPVVSVMFWTLAAPDDSQAQRSPFSSPLLAVYPPAGNWSVIVSAYSWPPTMVTPSSWLPALTKLAPQLRPTFVT
jgi:hypothetical protein